jgi:hypothetical protein
VFGNASVSIEDKEFGKTKIDVEALSKARSEICVTPSGITSLFTPKFWKAAKPIDVRPVPKVIEFILVP